jgi:hypothetical protein
MDMQHLDGLPACIAWVSVILGGLVLCGQAHKMLNGYAINISAPKLARKGSPEVVPSDWARAFGQRARL